MYHDTAKTGCDHRSGPILHIMTPSFEADTVQVSWSNCSRRDITHFLEWVSVALTDFLFIYFAIQSRSWKVLGRCADATRRILISRAASRRNVQRGSTMSIAIQRNRWGLEGVLAAGWDLFAALVLAEWNLYNIVETSCARHSLRAS